MESVTRLILDEKEKRRLVATLTPELAALRAKAGVSQGELANIIGVSRQTYGSMERRDREMSWNTFGTAT